MDLMVDYYRQNDSKWAWNVRSGIILINLLVNRRCLFLLLFSKKHENHENKWFLYSRELADATNDKILGKRENSSFIDNFPKESCGDFFVNTHFLYFEKYF